MDNFALFFIGSLFSCGGNGAAMLNHTGWRTRANMLAHILKYTDSSLDLPRKK